MTGCVAASERPSARRTLPPHAPTDAIVVRTDHFTFRLGRAVDHDWPARADETRSALGRALSLLLERELEVVGALAEQLGVVFPAQPLAFDAALARDDGVACGVDGTLGLGPRVTPLSFFACVLERSFVSLGAGSAVHAGLASGGAGDADHAYRCIARYAVTAVVVAEVHPGPADTRALDDALGAACDPAAIAWLSRAWVSRVHNAESADAFGARAGREVSPIQPPAPR